MRTIHLSCGDARLTSFSAFESAPATRRSATTLQLPQVEAYMSEVRPVYHREALRSVTSKDEVT
jgi:hypothetical protein